MKTNRMKLFLALALLAVLLSACGGTPAAATWPGLAADGNAAYLANGSVVHAIRLSDGEELWSFPEKPSAKLIFYANPVFTPDGQIIVGSSGSDHTLFFLDPDTGRETWSFTGASNHWVASPLVVDNLVYAPNADGTLYIFDLSIKGEDKLSGSVKLDGRLWAQPATDGNLIFVTSLEHKVFAVDPKTRTVAWKAELDGAIPGSPLAADGTLYVGSLGAALEAIDIATHQTIWSAATQGWLWGGPTLNDGILYFGDLDGNFYAIDSANGKPAAETTQPDGGILSSPLFWNGQIIFVTENGTVYSLTPGESPQSMEKLNGKLYTAPVTAGDLLLIAPFQGDYLLVALDKEGKEEWHYPTDKK